MSGPHGPWLRSNCQPRKTAGCCGTSRAELGRAPTTRCRLRGRLSCCDVAAVHLSARHDNHKLLIREGEPGAALAVCRRQVDFTCRGPSTPLLCEHRHEARELFQQQRSLAANAPLHCGSEQARTLGHRQVRASCLATPRALIGGPVPRAMQQLAFLSDQLKAVSAPHAAHKSSLQALEREWMRRHSCSCGHERTEATWRECRRCLLATTEQVPRLEKRRPGDAASLERGCQECGRGGERLLLLTGHHRGAADLPS
mmetsp:Transcript_8209/g.19311  ORF Transcript_8209/g.19311 Transcript_8209/m.19311 type:complete len:256 (+) Transcript_8209:123-890(+)